MSESDDPLTAFATAANHEQNTIGGSIGGDHGNLNSNSNANRSPSVSPSSSATVLALPAAQQVVPNKLLVYFTLIMCRISIYSEICIKMY